MSSQEPQFILFWPPAEYRHREGIAAAYQSLESAMMLLMLYRWPSVIPLIWSACETLLREHYNDHSALSQDLQVRFKNEHPAISDSLNQSASSLRKWRNELLHRGYSPKDDPRCAELMFNAGIPYFQGLVRELIGTDEINATIWDFWQIYTDTRKAITRKIKRKEADLNSAMFYLVGLLRFSLSSNFTSELMTSMWETSQELMIAEVEQTKQMVRRIERCEKTDGNCYQLPDFYCTNCKGGEILAGASFTGGSSAFHLDRLEVIGCTECGYLLFDQDLIKVFFEDKLTKEQKAELENENSSYHRS